MPSEKISRRGFLLGGGSVAAAILLLGREQFAKFFKKRGRIPGAIVGANATTGHLLRDFKFPEATSTEYEKIVIVGSGISGLSAARWLSKSGMDEYMLLELGNAAGGNSAAGGNEVSAYPWGAHYLPIPETNLTELIDFLRECGCVTGFDEKGLPVYNEYHLCFDPHERLFMHGTWQEGIIPDTGLTDDDSRQIEEFLRMMDSFKERVGDDGKPAFAIPVSRSSADAQFRQLDEISMSAFLQEHGFSSACLKWYVNYCCKDDYGTPLEKTSAWAGIHYFAARRGKGANAEQKEVLTWPEGNGFLVNKLQESLSRKSRLNALVYAVEVQGEKVKVLYYDVKDSASKCILADRVIMATPQFVNQRIVVAPGREIRNEVFSYSPWMVANITLKDIPKQSGFPLCWDNVLYHSPSLGYVNACQQHLNPYEKKKVITYYLPLTDAEPKAERMKAYGKKHEDWVSDIVRDLSKAHRNIEEEIEHIDVWIWGHGMIRPLPGFISGEERRKAARAHLDKIFFAHSDLSGISIFEEAFYQGIQAATEVLKRQQD